MKFIEPSQKTHFLFSKENNKFIKKGGI